ncbi:triose-phosphate isomerase [bacterium]|nr:MAG: triose-phosphate isomerase [bacterium]
MRKPIIAGNWKMYKTLKEGEELVNSLKRDLYDVDTADIVICPPYTLLSYLADMLEAGNISIGAQDLHWETEGAFTGEVSARMLKDAGCAYVIIGHSERRQFFAETNETVNKKLFAALKNELIPIVCVGENLNQREKGLTFDVIRGQLEEGLKTLKEDEAEKIIIAYEPVWAIGTGKVATPEQAQEVHKYIRQWLTQKFGARASGLIRLQYGGSVKPENIGGLISKEDIDGALVGGASLDAKSFSAIVRGSRKG